MIKGVVNARSEAVVSLKVRGPGGTETDVNTVVDPGFSSSLTLPAATVIALGLAQNSGGNAVLADGTVCKYDIYDAEVEWDGVLATCAGIRNPRRTTSWHAATCGLRTAN